MFRVIVPAIAGILLQDHLSISLTVCYTVLSICLLLQVPGFVWLNSKWYFRSRFLLGLALQISILCCFMIIHSIGNPAENKSELHPDKTIPGGDLRVVLIRELSQSEKFVRYEAELVSPLKSKIYLYIRSDSSFPGKEIEFIGTISPIKTSSNSDFDFKAYAARQGFYHQCFLSSDQIKSVSSSTLFPVRIYSARLQSIASEILTENIRDENTAAILQALICGDKRYLSEENRNTFSSTGAMHVLAVSGLHVGIIFLILFKAFQISFRRRKLPPTALLLICILIWSYAAMTGLTPSVSRASAMFSIILLSKIIDRQAHINNSIAAAAVILLCLNTDQLFQLGFQLSFLAVVSIVNLQPVIESALTFNNPIGQYIWSLTSVSISAQLGTMPLTTLAFGHFPTVFLLANFIVIPLAGLLICLGILTIITSPIEVLSRSFGALAEFFMSKQVALLECLQSIPNSSIEAQMPGLLSALAFYLILVFWTCIDRIKWLSFIQLNLMSILIWQLSFLAHRIW